MSRIISSQLKKNIFIDCNDNDLQSIIIEKVPPHLKGIKLILGSDTIWHWTTFEPNVNLLEQCLYDKTQIIPISYSWANHLIISFSYHDSDDPSVCVKKTIYEKNAELTDEKCTIYNERNNEYITGKRVIYNIKETIITNYYSPELIIQLVTPKRIDINLYEMKLWQKIKIKYTEEQMERVFNKFEMKLEDGSDVMELYNKTPNDYIEVIVLNTLQFIRGIGGFKYSF